VANILTAAEAARVLRTTEDDPIMLDLLPQVDAYLKTATSHDWAGDAEIRTEAKSAARMILVTWYENPGMMGSGGTSLQFGIRAALTHLISLAFQYREFRGRLGAGSIVVDGARVGDSVESLTGLIGVSGDQAASFESVISVDDQIQQISGADLSENWYRVHLVPVGER